MTQYIPKSALIAEIERRKKYYENIQMIKPVYESNIEDFSELLSFLDTLEVKEVDEQKERIDECPYRQVGCTMYKDKILECNGVCSWVVDHLKLKELKAQKGEEYESK